MHKTTTQKTKTMGMCTASVCTTTYYVRKSIQQNAHTKYATEQCARARTWDIATTSVTPFFPHFLYSKVLRIDGSVRWS